jgi:hypothetical protein
VSCGRELKRLLTTVSGVSDVWATGESYGYFDYYVPIASLPRVFGTTLDMIPARLPYVTVQAADVARWRRLLGPARGLRIGLAWAGRAGYANDRNRSIPPSLLASLANVAGVEYFSLHKTDSTTTAPDEPLHATTSDIPGASVVECGPHLRDFADTAALLANLDLLVSVDTSVLHLAGALGMPAAALLPLAPDWRWLLGRDDSPWYPTLRLFRQRAWGDWTTPIQEMTDFVAQRAAASV